jgi:hypothetical protein
MKSITPKAILLTLVACILFFPSQAFSMTLEEKVLRLEKIVAQQQKQIEALTAGQKISKQAAAPAKPIVKNDKVEVELYGQINAAVLSVDDGNQSETYIVDNDHSSTRVGLKAKTKNFEVATLGANVELEYQLNPSNLVSQSTKSVDGTFNERHIEVYVDFKKYGKFSIGQGDTASNSASEVDLSGTSVAGYSDIAVFSGGQLFFDNNSLSLTGTDIADVFSNLDGLSRTRRVRYDSPEFGGLMLSGSILSSSGHDIAARYDNSFELFKLKAAVAWSENAAAENTYNGSASILLNPGINFTVAAGERDFDSAGRDNADFLYGKVGYIFKLFSVGKTAASVDYGQYNNAAQNDDEATVYGLQLVQNVTDWDSQFYLGLRSHDLNRAGYEEITALLSGVRIKF